MERLVIGVLMMIPLLLIGSYVVRSIVYDALNLWYAGGFLGLAVFLAVPLIIAIGAYFTDDHHWGP